MKKNIAYICLLAACFAFHACKKTSPGDVGPFTNILPPYIQIDMDDQNTEYTEGDTALVTFQMRSVLEQDVTVTYSVTGAVTSSSQTVVIPKGETTADITIPLPANVVKSLTTSTELVVTLDKAVMADGSAMTIGQDNVPENQTVTIAIDPVSVQINTDDQIYEYTEGDAAVVGLQLGAVLTQNVTVTYSVTGAVKLTNKTIVIPKGETTADITIPIPGNAVKSPATSAEMVVKITKAAMTDGSPVAIGEDGKNVTITVDAL